MISIYPIVRIELSFVQFSLLCYEFCILSKTECKSIYYQFRREHESTSFPKLVRKKWICRETSEFFTLFIYNIFQNNSFLQELLLIFSAFNSLILYVQGLVFKT